MKKNTEDFIYIDKENIWEVFEELKDVPDEQIPTLKFGVSGAMMAHLATNFSRYSSHYCNELFELANFIAEESLEDSKRITETALALSLKSIDLIDQLEEDYFYDDANLTLVIKLVTTLLDLYRNYHYFCEVFGIDDTDDLN